MSDREYVSRLDTSVAHPARRYDYWLGGKDNFEADRVSGDLVAQAFPYVRTSAIQNRRYLARAVRHLVRDLGIRQFLDVGTGLPTANNTHQVAQSIAPDSRIVYVDNDPLVLAHARALLTGTPNGATAYIDADLRNPRDILSNPELMNTLDLTEPVGLLIIAVLHFMRDEDSPYEHVAALVKAMPSGSYLAMSHVTSDFMTPEQVEGVMAADRQTKVPFRFRSRAEFARFFEGLDLLPPGIVPTVDWRPDPDDEPRPTAVEAAAYGAVARIP
jgi:S-adenosyl methyltransferase